MRVHPAFQALRAPGFGLLLLAGCASSPPPPPPEKPSAAATRLDTDGDGIPDDIDRCPLEPEDRDGFQDEDGCPDLDNDGDGVADAVDRCPNDPGPPENRGCPPRDRDGDGVPDGDDRCPDQAGLRENQGCPDLDRDRDGVPDRIDRCPDAPGAVPDGCPKTYSMVMVTPDRIEVRVSVKFASASSRVLRSSGKLLDQVAQVMRDQPGLRVRVEGHTDRVGGESANLRLSRHRSEAVRQALAARGVEPDRLQAVGYGSSRPLASNRTASGRARNRRTDFHILPPGDME